MTFEALTSKFWEEDPGYFRLKQSCKTLIAILILMLITYSAPQLVKLLSAIAAGFSMQAIIGDSRKKHLRFIVIAFPIYLICYLIGYFSKEYALLSSVALVILGFLAVYVRRFGPEFFFAPIIAWSFCFLGILLPIPMQQYPLVIGSLILGLIVAAVIFLFLFPERKKKLFFENLDIFFKDYASALQWLAHILIHRTTPEAYEKDKATLKGHLFQLTIINGNIAQNQTSSETFGTNRLNYLYSKQYALAKVLTMILEGIGELIQAKITLSDTVRSHLFTVFAIYASALTNLDINSRDSNHAAVLKTLEIIESNLEEFQILLIECIIMKNKLVIPLININLGLRLILRNIQKMEHANEN